MKILILGANKELVSSASVSELVLGVVFVIDAVERQSYFFRQYSSLLLNFVDEYKDKNPVHEAFVVYNEDEDGNKTAECEVVFIAESKHEESLLRCGALYDDVDRGQYQCIVVRKELQKTVALLASTRDYAPVFDEAEFNRSVEIGTKAWSGVEDATAWVEDLRGNVHE